MGTGIEDVLEQFHRRLKKGDIFAAPRPGEPTSPARRRRSAAPHSWPFVQKQRKQRIECEFNESGHDGGHGSADLLMTRRHRDSLR